MLKLHKNKKIMVVLLAVLSILIASCFHVEKPEVKAGEFVGDIGIIGLRLNEDGHAEATLYNYEAGEMDAPKLTFFRDGVKCGNQANGSPTVLKGFEKTSFVSENKIAVEDDAEHAYMVTFAYKDSVLSDNNRTLLTGVKDETTPIEPTEPEQPKPSFTISNLKVEGERTAGERLTISADVTNTSQVTANVYVEFKIGDKTESLPPYNVNPGATKTLTWDWEAVEGTYTASAKAVWDGGSTETPSEDIIVGKKTEESPAFEITNLEMDGNMMEGWYQTVTVEVKNSSEVTATGEVTLIINGLFARIQIDNLEPGESYKAQREWRAMFDSTYQQKLTAELMCNDKRVDTKSVDINIRQNTAGSGYDIAITDISWTPENPEKGDRVVFSARIANLGTQDSPNKKHGIKFTVGNDSVFTWSDERQTSLQPGESVWVTANGRSDVQGHTETNYWNANNDGIYNVTAALDNKADFPNDKDDGNNSKRTVFAVGHVQIPDLPDLPSNGIDPNINVAPADSYGDRRNNSMKVTVGGMDSPSFNAKVNTCRYYAYGYYETTPVNIFEMKEEKDTVVRVALGKKMESVVVRPLSAGIEPVIKQTADGQDYAEFTVNKWGSYSVEFNGQTSGALQVFANPDYTNANLGGRYIPLGEMTWDAGGFGGTVYGSGVILSNHAGSQVTTAYSGARIYGVTIANENTEGYGKGGSWEIEIRDQGNIEFNYFHIIACGPNSDGISIQSSNNIRINNCYFRTWDDGVVLKNYTDGNTHTVTVNNTVFWTDLAQSMEIGAETNKKGYGDASITNVEFTNIDIIHSMHKPCMSIHNMDNATISDITWKNITIEDSHAGYNLGKEDGWPLIIDITNVIGGEVPGTAGGKDGWTHVDSRGSIENVTFEDIILIDWNNNGTAPKSNIEGKSLGNWENHKCPGIRMLNSPNGGVIGSKTDDNAKIKFKNVKLGGTKLTYENINSSFNSCIGGWGDMPQYTIQ